MVVIKNDAATPLTSLQMGISGSGQNLFGFDIDGLCSGSGPGGASRGPRRPAARSAPPATRARAPRSTSSTSTAGQSCSTPRWPRAPPRTSHSRPSPASSRRPATTTTGSRARSTAPNQPTPSAYVSVPVGTNVTDQATINGTHGAVERRGRRRRDGQRHDRLRAVRQRPLVQLDAGVHEPAEPVSQGIAAPSDPVGASLPAGRYYWMETYSGDGGGPNHNTPSQSICGQEVLGIGQSVDHHQALGVAWWRRTRR